MLGKPQKFKNELSVEISVDEAWGLLSNTDHLNRTIGLPKVRYDLSNDQNSLVRTAEATIAKLFKVKWVEYPFEWIQYKYYSVLREFASGPFHSIQARIFVSKVSATQSKVKIQCIIVARNLIGKILAPFVGKKGIRDTEKYLREFTLNSTKKFIEALPRKTESKPESQILADLIEVLVKKEQVSVELAKILETHLQRGTDEEVLRMRPYEMAYLWERPRDKVLHMFLHATKLGILEMDWELMCPNCRVPKGEFQHLSEIQTAYHCDVCGVSYEADFSTYTELRFSVAKSIRGADSAIYCIGSPFRARHIICQKLLTPGQNYEFEVTLKNEGYRLRSLRSNIKFELQPFPSGFTVSNFNLTQSQWQGIQNQFQPGINKIKIQNDTLQNIVFALEQTRWDTFALTAAEITNLQEFRKLFSSEVLSPGKQMGVRNITILFTDLKASTQLYEEIGDAPAFGRVVKHFGFLEEIIARNHGTILKTIGDAVMASFINKKDAALAALQIQTEIHQFNLTHQFQPPVVIKLGMHSGSAIVMNANEKLDYFGRTVNIAARIQNESVGSDIVVVEDFLQDIAIQKAMRDFETKVEPFITELKGVNEVFSLCRIYVKTKVKSDQSPKDASNQ